MKKTWKSAVEVSSLLDTLGNPPNLSEIFSLSRFWSSALYPENYKASERWDEIVTLTDYGDEASKLLHDNFPNLPAWELKLRLLICLYHHELYIDHEASDVQAIANLLSTELRQHRIQLPYRFGRLLYDRFHDMDVHGRTDHLPPELVAKLVNGTPQGVYQMDVFVSGPLGIIKSEDKRYFPPSTNLPLWHCSDTGCGALHSVECIQFDGSPPHDSRRFDDIVELQFGKPSEWFAPLMMMHRGEDYEFGRPFSDIPLVIGDCFFGVERSILVENLLRSRLSTAIREIISTAKGSGFLTGSPSEISSKLSEEEHLQILCLATDANLRDITDTLIHQKKIKLGRGENRGTKETSFFASHFDTDTEVGVLGLRSVNINPILKLTSLILSAYTESNSLSDLEWRLHTKTEQNIKSALVEYIGKSEPKKVISDVVFPSRDVTAYICSKVGLPVSHTEFSEDFSNHLLWKLGFNPPIFSDFCSRFHARIQEFETILLSLESIVGEDDREKIRSAGVNLFVSLEEFIETLVSYSSWTLGSDHFENTDFIYNSQEARALVPTLLGATQNSAGADFTWSTNGGNTLGCSLTYLNALVTWLLALDKADRESLLRPEVDLPHYAGNPNFMFPFRHVQLWADSEIQNIRSYGRELSEIARLLAQSNLAKIRNGLDHKRDEENFPTLDEMLGCSARIRQALEKSEARRYYPNEYWLISKHESQANFYEYELVDYRQRILRLNGPNMASGMKAAKFGQPLLIAPGNLIGVSNAEIIFRCSYKNAYSDYWVNYPKRRSVPPEDKRD